MNLTNKNKDYKYDICLSFAGEDRAYVKEVANALTDRDVRVFYDEYERSGLWGKDLYTHLDKVYQNLAQYCIIFISENYAAKVWTTHELKSAQSRAFKESEEYILPARFDDTILPGIRDTVGYIDLRKTTPFELALSVLEKLGLPKGIDSDTPVSLKKELQPKYPQWFGRKFVEENDRINEIIIDSFDPPILTIAHQIGDLDTYRLSTTEELVAKQRLPDPVHDVARLSLDIVLAGTPWGVYAVDQRKSTIQWHYDYRKEVNGKNDDGAVITLSHHNISQSAESIFVGSHHHVRALSVDGHLKWKRKVPGRVWSLSTSKEQQAICVGSWDGTLDLIDCESGERETRVSLGTTISWCEWSPDSKVVAAIAGDRLHFISSDGIKIEKYVLADYIRHELLGYQWDELDEELGIMSNPNLGPAAFISSDVIAICGTIEGAGGDTMVLLVNLNGKVIQSILLPRHIRWIKKIRNQRGVFAIGDQGSIDIIFG